MARGNKEAELDPQRSDSGSANARQPAPRTEQKALSRRSAFARERLDALGQLLDDESPTVWREVRRQLNAAGKRALPLLRKTASQSDSPRARARARTLLLAREREKVIRRLIRYVMRPRIDLEDALLMLARHHSPKLDVRRYKKALDRLARGLVQRSASCTNDYERCMALCEYLGQELRSGRAHV